MNIQVGDRVTYINKEGIKKEIIIYDYYIWESFTTTFDKASIIKIERPKYEVVEEKKELLTEEEKEFLKDICKYYDVTEIKFNNVEVKIIKDSYLLSCSDYPDNMKFENVERGKRYTLEELGLEES